MPSVQQASAVFLLASAALAQDPPKPWRLDSALDTPESLTVSGQYRARFESLNGQFRASPALRNNEDQLASRLDLRIAYEHDHFGATIEGLDGRMYGTENNSFANTTTVNTFDVLQANVSFRADGHAITLGRYTMDLGSRRLIARNRFRNTVNSFNGVRWDYADDDSGIEAGAFWNMPTIRRPSARMDLVDNEHDFDKSSSDYQFYGVHALTPVDDNSSIQGYLLARDDTRGATDEQLWTAGVRYFRPAKRGQFHAEGEVAYQIGDRNGQDVLAWFGHASVGYTCDCDIEPSIRVAIDAATGNDGTNDYTRFNTLFGARRFEYGPTGIYGAIGRRNLISPEIRVSVRPTKTTWILAAWRDVRLENGNDAWVEAGDNTGQGRHVGNQTEVRLRWEPIKKGLRLETGAAYFAGGRFRETSTAGRSSDSRYFFFESIFTF